MPLEPGQTLSHYRIERQIGKGGMGAVFLAEDILETGRPQPQDSDVVLAVPRQLFAARLLRWLFGSKERTAK